MSSRMDGLMFYVLASGSILLTIAFTSHSVEWIRGIFAHGDSKPMRIKPTAKPRDGYQSAGMGLTDRRE